MKKNFLRVICCAVICTSLIQSEVYSASVSAFKEHYEAGQNYLMQNQFSSAIVEFRKSLRINYLDNSARIGLINSFLARASYYANEEKNYDKAANDFRSALFYLKMYPEKEQSIQNSIGMISSATANLNQCLKVLSYDKTPSARYKRAEELRAMGNFSAAAYEFSKAAESDSLAADANVQIADLMKLLGNDTRSAYYYQTALNLNPNDGILRMKYARTLDKIGEYDSAVKEYNDALANSKGDMEVLYALERIYLKKLAQTPSDAELNANIGAIKQAQGDFESALNYYGRAEQLNPNNVTTRINVGTLFQQKKDYNKALQSYESVLTLYPDNTKALFYKAELLNEMGNKKGALSVYQKVVSLEPSNTQARNAITSIVRETMTPGEYIAYLSKNGTSSELYDFAYKLHKENKTDDAINAYKAVIARDASKVEAYVNLAICYASKDDYKSAVTTLETAKSKFPNNKEVIKTLGEVKADDISSKMASASASYDSKDYNKAIKEYLLINPPTETSLLGVAASYQALQDYYNAIEYYKKAADINPKNAEIPYYIGYLYSEQNNWAQAESYLNKAISMNPNSEAKNLLSYVKQNGTLGVLNEAIDLFEKHDYQSSFNKLSDVIKKEPTNAYAYYYRGLIYDERKEPKLAIGDFLSTVKNSNEFPIANYMIAVDYDTLENYKDAFKYYKIFVSKYTTEDEYLKYAKDRMKELEPYIGG